MGYQIKIDAFEGPIDLLLHLLKKNKVEICDIKISEITEQYLDYINRMQQFNLNIASEFLVMAAKLMEIKAQTLLPTPKTEEDDDEVDLKQQLVERLLEYKKYKKLATELQEFEKKQRERYTRNVAPLLADLDFEAENPLEEVELDQFVTAFEKVIKQAIVKKKQQQEDEEAEEEKLSYLSPEEVTISEQEEYIRKSLVLAGGKINSADLFVELNSRLEIVVTFMALLELIKKQELKVEQDVNFSEIKIYYTGMMPNVRSI
ncbi:segregation/condensation protein A [Natroniella sulfidigena]|uniref:segregation and condensation protein A n=1 Tax=Natroniella sulfidigena TaxID=723921 RepID=UPI00200ABAE4|nr:segregation/condensation protein A [Natroniella sulfidigena]MCK8816573.1 segregation/condensation protein A [Natroniella sulfidigena]